MTLRLAIPSKGRLQEQAIDWFAARGVTIRRVGSGREYAGVVDGLEGVELALLSAGEIPRELEAGRVHVGVTGRDLIREKLHNWDSKVRELAPLGFGFADLVVAVPDAWVDVETLEDLDEVAAQFRAQHGHRLRVATKYHRLVRSFFRAEGVADWRIVDSQGATEGTIVNETAEVIADITTTGETLTANHLRVLSDGLILKSEAILVESLRADAPKALLQTLRDRLGV